MHSFISEVDPGGLGGLQPPGFYKGVSEARKVWSHLAYCTMRLQFVLAVCSGKFEVLSL